MNRSLSILIGFLMMSTIYAWSQDQVFSLIKSTVEKNMASWEAMYIDLHQTPELSFKEFQTSDKMAAHLESLGFSVTRNIGGTGLVGVFENGDGPVVLLRTDMDALPIIEKTNLPFASTMIYETGTGKKVGAMHACGHDAHMSVWAGTAHTLLAMKEQWKGTLVMIAQQAEEQSGGANKMIEDGLFNKFPVPDYALALHLDPALEAGTIGYCIGPAFAGVSSVDIKVHGSGGHGALPQNAIDPVVLSSRIILDLQTIISREISPLKPAVITVGSIHGGTQHNIIPDEVNLQLTLRFYDDLVYEHMLKAIKRITRGIAESAGLPEDKFPEVSVLGGQITPPVINDTHLTEDFIKISTQILGPENVFIQDPLMAGEDFGKYGRTQENIPIMMFMLGSVPHQKFIDHAKNGTPLPGLHSPLFAPDYKTTIKTGILTMSAAVIKLSNK